MSDIEKRTQKLIENRFHFLDSENARECCYILAEEIVLLRDQLYAIKLATAKGHITSPRGKEWLDAFLKELGGENE